MYTKCPILSHLLLVLYTQQAYLYIRLRLYFNYFKHSSTIFTSVCNYVYIPRIVDMDSLSVALLAVFLYEHTQTQIYKHTQGQAHT